VQSKKILLIVDAAADAHAVRKALAGSTYAGFQVARVRSCAAGLERLLAAPPHPPADAFVAVVAELSLPDAEGIESLLCLQRAAPQLPILVLCTRQTEALARLAVQHGAQDYLLKERLDRYQLPKMLDSMIQRVNVSSARYEEQERARVTLDSIGDAVISSDLVGRVTYLNTVAEAMTGWTLGAAKGHRVDEVLQLVDATTREKVRSPMAAAVSEEKTVGLTANCLQIGRGGHETFIEDSAAPIHDRGGQMTGAVMVFHDVSAIRALARRDSFLAHHDSLTGLPNRMLLNDRLSQALALAHRHAENKLAVLFIDLDGFKQINDTRGHAVGDLLLQSVAHRLLKCVRKSDTVSRQGGDEFVVLLAEIGHAHDAALVADKMLHSLRTAHPAEQHLLHVTGSIGISTFPEDGTEAHELMNNADLAMLRAKANGRDNYRFFGSELTAQAIRRQDLVNGDGAIQLLPRLKPRARARAR
jgi:diguanylate cyclase (GGDEF)-like protein/PAS domain S-box-containing protein